VLSMINRQDAIKPLPAGLPKTASKLTVESLRTVLMSIWADKAGPHAEEMIKLIWPRYWRLQRGQVLAAAQTQPRTLTPLQIVEEATSRRISGKADVIDIERRLGGELPEDYLAFLVKWNGGRPKPDCFPFWEFGWMTDGGIQFFFGVYDDSAGYPCYSIANNLDAYDGRIPPGYCPIACDSCGNLVLLGVVGAERGAVYFWDHELETGEPVMDNMSRIAGSFTEFVESLKEYEE